MTRSTSEIKSPRTMGLKKEKVTVCTCERCGHRWVPREPFGPLKDAVLAKNCPKCKNPKWNVPRKAEPKKKPA